MGWDRCRPWMWRNESLQFQERIEQVIDGRNNLGRRLIGPLEGDHSDRLFVQVDSRDREFLALQRLLKRAETLVGRFNRSRALGGVADELVVKLGQRRAILRAESRLLESS